jgi:hypothetical protein
VRKRDRRMALRLAILLGVGSAATAASWIFDLDQFRTVIISQVAALTMIVVGEI